MFGSKSSYRERQLKMLTRYPRIFPRNLRIKGHNETAFLTNNNVEQKYFYNGSLEKKTSVKRTQQLYNTYNHNPHCSTY